MRTTNEKFAKYVRESVEKVAKVTDMIEAEIPIKKLIEKNGE